MLESIEKLRERLLNYAPNIRRDVNMALDDIRSEIEDKYMKLPCDKDGVPIHYGDVLEYGANNLRHKGKVCILDYPGSWIVNCGAWVDPDHTRHVKHDPLKELLNDHLQEREKIVRKLESSLITLGEAESEEDACDNLFAERIRELLGGDAE